jgi:hypothetical protein
MVLLQCASMGFTATIWHGRGMVARSLYETGIARPAWAQTGASEEGDTWTICGPDWAKDPDNRRA